LNDWSRVPGSDDQGTIDGSALEAWVKRVRMLCAESGYAEIGDQRIGEIFAAANPDTDGLWPPAPVRKVIENTRSKELENGIRLGVQSRRAVTTRLSGEGGAQERAQAARHRAQARALAFEGPRTAALLERVARDYDEDAKHQDEQAERHGWL
jgi:hypothetical protein